MQIEGKNSVLEALYANKRFDRLLIQKGLNSSKQVNKLFDLARERNIKYEIVGKYELDKLSKTKNHQGVIAIVSDYDYCLIDDILQKADALNKDALIVILDGIEDPFNFGNIIRTCECAGVDGIIIPKHRACGINETVAKVSAGAINHMLISRVSNINDAINKLKAEGFWVFGTAMDGKEAKTLDLTGKIAIIIGNEGNGMHELTRKNCDDMIAIKMRGQLNSLNAGVATGIVLFQALEQRP